jgi:inosine-uridine nucleoside N-ribohydrolase
MHLWRHDGALYVAMAPREGHSPLEPRSVIIDCDTGVDDAMATLLALRSPALNVVGITCVAGNTTLDKVVRNTLVVVEHSGKQVPVYEGSPKPLLTPLQVAEYAHGSDGLGDIGFPDPAGAPQAEHAVEFLVRTFSEADQPLHLITLGPLTNVAQALMREPKLEQRIRSLLMMAGGICGGNTSAAAEFNVWVDPEAADVVFRSAIPKTMVALDPIMRYARFTEEDVEQLEACEQPWCWMVSRLMRSRLKRWKGPISPPDVAAMGVAIDPTIASGQGYAVAVETKGEHTRGMTVVDRRRWREMLGIEPNVHVVEQIDTSRYRELFVSTLLGV